MVPFCSVPYCPTVSFCPNIPCSILPPRLRLENRHYVNYYIARCSIIKWCENANKSYIIIFNHMQRFCYLICQRFWCQNTSKLIYQKGEISFLWDTQSVVYCKFDFHVWRWTDRWQNQLGVKIDPRQTCFLQNTRCSILPPCSILPRLHILKTNILKTYIPTALCLQVPEQFIYSFIAIDYYS